MKKSVSKLEEYFKCVSLVLLFKLEGMTKSSWRDIPIFLRFDFCKNSKISTTINRQGLLDPLKYFTWVGTVFLWGRAFAEEFYPGIGLLTEVRTIYLEPVWDCH